MQRECCRLLNRVVKVRKNEGVLARHRSIEQDYALDLLRSFVDDGFVGVLHKYVDPFGIFSTMHVVGSLDKSWLCVTDILIQHSGRARFNNKISEVLRHEIMHVLFPSRVNFVVFQLDIIFRCHCVRKLWICDNFLDVALLENAVSVLVLWWLFSPCSSVVVALRFIILFFLTLFCSFFLIVASVAKQTSLD